MGIVCKLGGGRVGGVVYMWLGEYLVEGCGVCMGCVVGAWCVCVWGWVACAHVGGFSLLPPLPLDFPPACALGNPSPVPGNDQLIRTTLGQKRPGSPNQLIVSWQEPSMGSNPGMVSAH